MKQDRIGISAITHDGKILEIVKLFKTYKMFSENQKNEIKLECRDIY